MNRYIYHYCAQYSPEGLVPTYTDGLLHAEEPVNTLESYRNIKKMIDPKNCKSMVITSLAFIGMEGVSDGHKKSP
jgi:hypothetical protein